MDKKFYNQEALKDNKNIIISMTHQKLKNTCMQSLVSYAAAVLCIINIFCIKVHASENTSILDESQIIITDKYADRFCSAKDDHFFEGLDNEKALKYSYYKYIGLQSEEILSDDIYKSLINQIRSKCLISDSEEKEIIDFFLKKQK
tara:strand:- start:2169 stop:2606 length:438 start_codon:yes stop_codon:yes gene_type:complete